MKTFVLRPRKGTPDNGPVVVRVSGGLPADNPDALEAAQQIRKLVADGRVVVIHGGLPDTLTGELMSAQEREKFNNEQCAAAMGSGLNVGSSHFGE